MRLLACLIVAPQRATMSQQSSLTQSAHSVRQVLTAYTHSMPPESMTCGIVSQTKDDAKPTDTIYSMVLNVEGKSSEITSFDATHVAVDGKTYTRSDQYEGALAWDKKTFQALVLRGNTHDQGRPS